MHGSWIVACNADTVRRPSCVLRRPGDGDHHGHELLPGLPLPLRPQRHRLRRHGQRRPQRRAPPRRHHRHAVQEVTILPAAICTDHESTTYIQIEILPLLHKSKTCQTDPFLHFCDGFVLVEKVIRFQKTPNRDRQSAFINGALLLFLAARDIRIGATIMSSTSTLTVR